MGIAFQAKLSWPPPGNMMARPGKGRHYPNPDYVAWLHANLLELLVVATAPPIEGPVAVRATFYPKTNRRYDLDNHFKPCGDLLEKAGVIVNDSQIVELVLRKAEKRPGEPHVVVELEELAQ